MHYLRITYKYHRVWTIIISIIILIFILNTFISNLFKILSVLPMSRFLLKYLYFVRNQNQKPFYSRRRSFWQFVEVENQNILF